MKLLVEIPGLGEHNLTLTIEEARIIYNELDKIFGKKAVELKYPDGVRTPFTPDPFIKKTDRTNPYDKGLTWNCEHTNGEMGIS